MLSRLFSIIILLIALHLNRIDPQFINHIPDSSIGCHIVTERNVSWRLTWQDTFDAEDYSTINWRQANEPNNCLNQTQFNVTRCALERNVRYEQSFLLLKVHHEDVFDSIYSHALVHSRWPVKKGRWEVRAALPTGDYISVYMFTTDPRAGYWGEFGDVRFVNYEGISWLSRAISFGGNATETVWNDMMVNQDSLAQFHLYGVEWNEDSMRFFYDDQYSEPFDITNHTFMANSNLAFKMQVGKDVMQYSFPATFEELNWQCPALLIDYVRLYELVVKNETVTSAAICPEIETPNADLIRTEICARLMAEMMPGFGDYVGYYLKNFKISLTIMTVLNLLILFLSIFTCRLMKQNVNEEEIYAKLKVKQQNVGDDMFLN